MNPEIIAFYLPQFHPTQNNNKWWGEGFTEWTNVAKAKPLYRNHYQPKIPSDLGFYDLRMPEVRLKQSELAKQAGVTGFCYYHYWFENGKEELDFPFKEVLRLGEPDFPFCLCWANESWHRKFWNKDGSVSAESVLLAEQKYLGEEDNRMHFETLKNAFIDKRYIKVNGKPLFMIYRPLAFKDIRSFIVQWNKLANDIGFDGFHFVGYTLNVKEEYQKLINLGFDAVCSCHLGYGKQSTFKLFCRKICSLFTSIPMRFKYKDIIETLVTPEDGIENVYPTIVPNWDHTPRSGVRGYLYEDSTPELFQEHAEEVLRIVSHKKINNQIAFLKSWNEWGEGNYMEPDLRYGRGYICALRNALNNLK